VTAEQGDLAGMQDAGNVISLLQQETSVGVDDDGAGDLAIRSCVHEFAPHRNLRIELGFRIAPPDLTSIELIEISAMAPDRDHHHRANQRPGETQPRIFNV
jgi:hypothetical protein